MNLFSQPTTSDLQKQVHDLEDVNNVLMRQLTELQLIVCYLLHRSAGELSISKVELHKMTVQPFLIEGESSMQEIIIRFATPAESSDVQ
jgi:hypothetical protein